MRKNGKGIHRTKCTVIQACIASVFYFYSHILELERRNEEEREGQSNIKDHNQFDSLVNLLNSRSGP